MIIRTNELTHIYGIGTAFEKKAVDSVSIELKSGELVGLIGHTGSGKSTLIQHLNGLLKPTKGTVTVDGEDIFARGYSRSKLRSSVGLVFQYPEHQLFEETVYKDIAFGPKNMGLDADETDRRVHKAAGFVGLDGETLEKSPFELSGGQKRRAALAGVMAMEPQMLILDEPAAGLDPLSRRRIMLDILDYAADTGCGILLVSHSMEDIANYMQRVVVMSHGRILMQGGTREIFGRVNELTENELAVPQITRIFHDLGIGRTVLNMDEGLEAAKEYLGINIPDGDKTEL